MSKAVFISYASQDAEAAKRICDALRQAGVEVWFDLNELRGGDSWDQKIRRQIKECSLFMPVISAATQARGEGYFRLEWKLAVDRSHLMADDTPFLFPVVIDDTSDSSARVPDRFREVQWTRLNVKDTPETLAARVGKLLAKADDEAENEEEEDRGERRPGRKRGGKPAWLRYITTLAGLAIGLVYAIKGVWHSDRGDANAPAAQPAPPSLSPPNPPREISEARQLVARARAMSLDKYDSTADDFAAADNLIKRALELDPNEGEIWAASSLLNFSFGSRGFDHAPSRGAAARSHAERALSLSPDSLEGLFALGRWQRDNEEPAVAEATFKKILAREPNHVGALGNLAWVYESLNRVDEAAELYERCAALPNGNPALMRYLEFLLYFHRSRFEEAERCIRLSLASQPSSNSQAGMVMLLLTWKGDLDGAAQVFASGSTAGRSEPRTVWTTVLVQLCQRAPEQVLKTLERFSDDYIQDNWFSGPKAYLTGRAHAMAGRREAARLAWQVGLAVVDTRLKAAPESRNLHLMRGQLLALLDQKGEALREAKVVEELSRIEAVWFQSPALIYAALGRADEALPLLEKQLRLSREQHNVGWPLTPALLRLDPRWDGIRDDARFQALYAEPKKAPVTAAPIPAPDSKSVAVLAFANLSEDRNNEYFSDGISEELLNVLAKIPALKVSARTSAFYFKGKEVPIPEIARQLGVAYVVEGSVRRSGDRVRITAQLISAASGFHVWSDTFTRDLKDIFAVQDEIAGLIAKQLQVEMGMTPPESRREVNPEAHRLVLEGRHYWNLRTEDGFMRAEAAFMRAIEADPKFAQAHAGLADVLASRAIYLSYRGLESTTATRARTEAQRALALDPSLAEAYPALGAVCLFEGKLAEAEQQFQKAFALNPNYPLAHHWYALVLEVQGRLDVALKEIDLAIQFDPLSVMALHTRGRLLNNVRRYTEALADFSQVQVLRPDMIAPTGARGMSLLGLGRNDEAFSAAKTVVTSDEVELRLNADLEAVLVLDKTGHRQDAEQHVARLIPRLAEGSYVRGTVLAALGRWEEALPYLESTPPTMKYIFYWHPVWERWRDDPRFQQLLAKLGCEKEYGVARATVAQMLKENAVKTAQTK